VEWIFRYALVKRRKKASMKRLISAFHKSFSVFGFWLLAFGFSFFFLLFPPALNVPADLIVSANIHFYEVISGSHIRIRLQQRCQEP
jgi:hypothetical protein